ncbi:MAG: rhomboid family intramembrane serine protease [Pseudomonadales bacterium]|nr:rhomboid family intramembrane serine protease [Pseudomonadales bacterium]
MTDSNTLKIPDVVYLLAVMWGVYVLQWLVPGNLQQFGILPRTLSGLWHIPIAPFIHGSLYHLIANTLPLLGLGFLIQLKQRSLFWELTGITIVLSGFGTWLIGSSAYHIGASGLVLGLWAYIFADAFLRRSIRAIVIAVITLFLYGGLIFTLFDIRLHISWAGHMSGMVSGVLVAWLNIRGEKRSADNES